MAGDAYSSRSEFFVNGGNHTGIFGNVLTTEVGLTKLQRREIGVGREK